jgi:hypothetical protein
MHYWERGSVGVAGTWGFQLVGNTRVAADFGGVNPPIWSEKTGGTEREPRDNQRGI